MRVLRTAAAVVLAASGLLAASVATGDARRGEQVFRNEQCARCHRLGGQGGGAATDLTRRVDRNYTPAGMVGLMWNHGPEMWAGMKSQGIVKSTLSAESAADLFAFFVAARYFEKPGDAGRGKQLFASKGCARCHVVAGSGGAAGAPPVAKWESLADPLALAQQMWSHAPRMREAFATKGMARPQLNGQELADILVYLQNLPETKGLPRNLQIEPSGSGAALFQAKCAPCHTGRNALEARLHDQTLTDIAAAMWSHHTGAKQPAALSGGEMRQIIGYVWERQYAGGGSASSGRKVFETERCSACHASGAGGPALAKGKGGYDAVAMIAALWDHGPRMQVMMVEKRIAWPRFTAQQMTDLIAYLNSL
jgi:mono/diheme cytochrome c family protein